MTVFDASVLVDALVVDGPDGEHARAALRNVDDLAVPAIFTAEAASALRRLHLASEISETVARNALDAVATVRTAAYPFPPFIGRVWELRHAMTVYDAWYVALAESLRTTLVTADARLARSVGARCPVLDVVTFTARRS